MPLKTLELKAAVHYNSVRVFLFHLRVPVLFFSNICLLKTERNTNQYFQSPKSTAYIFFWFCLLIGKNPKFSKRLMNSHVPISLHEASRSFTKNRKPIFNTRTLGFIIASFVFSLSLKIVKSPKVFLMVTSTHLESILPSQWARNSILIL